MVKNKTPIWETNDSPSEFVPSDPALNAALSNSVVEGMGYNGETLDAMREKSVVYDNSASGLDKIAQINQELQKTIPEAKKSAENYQNLYKSMHSKK